MVSPTGPQFSRRVLLLGAAGAVFLASCGDDDDDTSASTTTTTAGPMRRFFGDDWIVAGRPQRLTFGLLDPEGVGLTDVPAMLEFQIHDFGGRALGDPISAARHNTGIPHPYYPVAISLPEPGMYTIRAEQDGRSVETTFQVVDSGETTIPQIGDPMPSIDTPTTVDARGVNPICTAEPQCPLHDVTLRDALAGGAPVAFLVSTPEFCQIAICGPVLDVLLSQRDAFPGVRMLHGEVYTDETTSTTTPTVQALGLTFEPCLFLVGSNGIVAARLDNIYDQTELVAALTALS